MCVFLFVLIFISIATSCSENGRVLFKKMVVLFITMAFCCRKFPSLALDLCEKYFLLLVPNVWNCNLIKCVLVALVWYYGAR